MKKVYLDHAASAPLLPEVLDSMFPFFTEHFGNPNSVHSWGRVTRTAIERVRKLIADYLQVSSAEIIFTSCGTESNNMVLQGAVRNLGVKRIITSTAEHHCVLHTAMNLQETGIEVVFLQPDQAGLISVNELVDVLSSGSVKTLVSLMEVNNEIGARISLEEVAQVCKQYGALFHTDATQSVGWYSYNLNQTPVDFLSASAHKFHGPKGIGFVYCRTGVSPGPLLFGGAQERNMRAGTENVAGIVGMGKALELAIQNMEHRRLVISRLRSHFIQAIRAAVPQAIIQGPIEERSTSYRILNIRFPLNQRTSLLIYNLDIAGIAASGGSACSSGTLQVSHVLKAIQMPEDQVAVRFSLSFLNTVEEIDYTVDTLQKQFAV